MTIDLGNVVVRHERRLRLLFTNTLAAGAFSTPSLYTIVNQDGAGPDCNVTQAFAVPNTPGGVELALDQDLVDGGLYLVSAVGVPCTDTTVTGASSTELIRVGFGTKAANVEPAATTTDRDALLYFRDLAWDGNDLIEDASGDLAIVSGQPNWINAIVRREMGEPLLWDPDYSPRAREFLNAPNVTVDKLRAALVRQAKLDPRTADARATILTPLDGAGEQQQISITAQPVGGKPQTKQLPLQNA